MSTISNAFQMASRKGHDVALAVAGLPQSYEKVIHQAGCTFMRRAAHVVLGPLTKKEVRSAFADVFRNMRGVSLQEPALEELVGFSKGHPYIMQLEGFYLVEHLNDAGFSSGKVDVNDVCAVLPTALDSYFDRALQPLFDELPRIEREYLVAMADVADEKGVAQTSDIAQKLGKTQSQTSQVRSYLLSGNLVYAPARGLLAYAIPYLGNYLKKGLPREHNGLAVIEEWL